MRRDVFICRLKRAALAPVLRVAQQRHAFGQGGKHRFRRFGAPVVYYNDSVIRIPFEFRDYAKQLFVRLISRYHNDHARYPHKK